MFLNWRINRIKVKLAGVDAALAAERDMQSRTGDIYPIVYSNMIREQAELNETLRQLQDKLELQKLIDDDIASKPYFGPM